MFEGLEPKKKESLCHLMKKAAELDKADYDILMDAIASPLWSGAALSTELNNRGFTINKGAVSSHRSGSCACARVA